MKLIIMLAVSLLSFNAMADSISVTIKPARGITGTTSINFHADGQVTALVYHSPSHITENPLSLSPEQATRLRQQAAATLAEYLSQQQFDGVKLQQQTLGIAHSHDGVTKSISSRKHSSSATALIQALKKLFPQ